MGSRSYRSSTIHVGALVGRGRHRYGPEAQFLVQRQRRREPGIREQPDPAGAQLPGFSQYCLPESPANAQALSVGRNGHLRQLIHAVVLVDEGTGPHQLPAVTGQVDMAAGRQNVGFRVVEHQIIKGLQRKIASNPLVVEGAKDGLMYRFVVEDTQVSRHKKRAEW